MNNRKKSGYSIVSELVKEKESIKKDSNLMRLCKEIIEVKQKLQQTINKGDKATIWIHTMHNARYLRFFRE